MSENKLVFAIGGLLAGLLIGFFGANALNKSAATQESLTVSNSNGAVPAGVTSMAIDELLEKANSEPQNFVVQMQTGQMYAQIGRFDQAVEFYKRGLILQPENFQANVVLANALFDSGKFEEAEGYYSKALTINDKDVNARIDLGTTFVERANPDYDRAIKEFATALEIDPKSEPAVYYLGIAHHRKGDMETARTKLQELETMNAASPLVGRLRQNIENPR